MVTVVGVAYRGNIRLDDIEVDFQVEPVETPDSPGFGVRKRVVLHGQISESELVRLERASQFCPVGQALTKGSMDIQDQVRWSNGETASLEPSLKGQETPTGHLPAVPTGSVQGRYLLDTKEFAEDGTMVHEGEVKVSALCQNLNRSSRWTYIAGHSGEGWVPPPFPFAQAGWASSTATTLRTLLPEVSANQTALRVELAMMPRGGAGQAQANAAAGIIASRQVTRRIQLPGSPQDLPLDKVGAALERDPITIAYRKGGVLLDDQTVVE